MNFWEAVAAFLKSLGGKPQTVERVDVLAQVKSDVSRMKVKNIEMIKESEGLRLKAYLPTPNDVWTIGYGHTKGVRPGDIITEDEAVEFLYQDLDWVEKVIYSTVKVPLTQNQFDALASLIYNIGGTNFRGSTVLKRLNSKNYSGAADAFLMWNKQRNRKTGQLEELRGLTIRRRKERELFLK